MGFKKVYLAKRNPNVKIEDWPRTWRSHAVYVSQFDVVGASYSRVMYCSRIPDAPGPGLFTVYDGVALLSCETAADMHSGMPAEVREKVDIDELRVFSAPVKDFTLNCEELLTYGDVTCAVAIIRFLTRKPDITAQDFDTRWSGSHARLAMEAMASGAPLGYVHNRVIEKPPPGYEFDGISELWFADAHQAAEAMAGSEFDALNHDLEQFCDVERSVTLLTRVTHLWPRG